MSPPDAARAPHPTPGPALEALEVPLMLSHAAALIVSLWFNESASLPVGEVKRVTLLGYAVAGEILKLDEAIARAERAEVLALRPGLVRIEPPAAPSPADISAPLALATDNAAEIVPVACEAVLCVACDGGARRPRLGCQRCEGRFVRVFRTAEPQRELTPSSPPGDEEERIGAAYALAKVAPNLTPPQRGGAQKLYAMVTQGLSLLGRRKASEEWDRNLDQARREGANQWGYTTKRRGY